MAAEENIWSHYGVWGAVIFWILVYGLFILFVPFYKKSIWKPTGAYMAFVVAFAIEMHGFPFSMYLFGAIFGKRLPEGIFWGHTLEQYIGANGISGTIVCAVTGIALVYAGWRDIYRNYWSKHEGKGRLVTSGIYRYIRHPQYTGFLLISLGMLCEWATIPLLIMYPLMIALYYRLARREEQDMAQEFGPEYVAYKAQTGMFLPRIGRGRPAVVENP